MEFRNPFTKCEFYSKMSDSMKKTVGWGPDDKGEVKIKIGELTQIMWPIITGYGKGADVILASDKAIWETQRQALEIIISDGFVTLYDVEQIFRKEMKLRMEEN